MRATPQSVDEFNPITSGRFYPIHDSENRESNVSRTQFEDTDRPLDVPRLLSVDFTDALNRIVSSTAVCPSCETP